MAPVKVSAVWRSRAQNTAWGCVMTGSLQHISQTHKPWSFTAAEVNQNINDNVPSRLMYVGTNIIITGMENLGKHAIYRINSCEYKTEREKVMPLFHGLTLIAHSGEAEAVQTLIDCDKGSAYHSGSSTSEIQKQLVRSKVGHSPCFLWLFYFFNLLRCSDLDNAHTARCRQLGGCCTTILQRLHSFKQSGLSLTCT